MLYVCTYVILSVSQMSCIECQIALHVWQGWIQGKGKGWTPPLTFRLYMIIMNFGNSVVIWSPIIQMLIKPSLKALSTKGYATVTQISHSIHHNYTTNFLLCFIIPVLKFYIFSQNYHQMLLRREGALDLLTLCMSWLCCARYVAAVTSIPVCPLP